MTRITYAPELIKTVVDEYFFNGLCYKKIASKYSLSCDTIRRRIKKAQLSRLPIKQTDLDMESNDVVDITDFVKERTTPNEDTSEYFEFTIQGLTIRADKKTSRAIIEVLRKV